ncbi:hypothetical protein niasHT_013833 [Heterodera trifolii]|uniref:Uncharacterized protein n=1 Tax=Heterodera trifolii TaxID=157864 RepID=A0ABD2KTJ9_9BILA
MWPLLKDGIRTTILRPGDLRRLRRFGYSSILSDCPSLRFVFSNRDVFPELPPDDSADATAGQAIAKWLCSPRPDGVPKVLKFCIEFNEEEWPSQINGLITAFSTASSRVNFIIVICNSSDYAFIVPFDLTNELTGQRTLKRAKNNQKILLIRCPISRDENKWTNWENEAIELNYKELWNKIHIAIVEEEIGEGLIDGTPDPSD